MTKSTELLFENKVRKRKKWLAVLLCLLMTLTAVFAPITAAAAAQPAPSERKTVRLCFAPMEGCFIQADDGLKSGYGYEIMQKMLVYENWSYEYVGSEAERTQEEMLGFLENGKADMLAYALKTPERLERFYYSDLPIGNQARLIAVKAGDNRLSINNYDKWNGITIGFLGGQEERAAFDLYAAQNGFTYRTQKFSDQTALEQALQAGKVDAIVTGNFRALPDVWVLDQFDEEPLYVLVSKAKPELLFEVNDALAKMQAATPNYQAEIYQTYYTSDRESAIAYTREESAFIEQCTQNGTVFKALINPDRKPLSYYENNEVKGLLKDVCQTIFDRSGLRVEFIVTTNRDEYVAELANADIVCDFTGSTGATEKKGFIQVGSYYNSTTSMLRRKDYDGTGNRCALVGSGVSSWLRDNLVDTEFLSYDTVDDCIEAVIKGEADFLYSYTRCVQEWVYADITNSLVVVADNHQKTDFSIGVRNDQNANLSSILSKSIDTLTTDDISSIADNYTHYEKTNTSLLAMIYDQPVYFIMFALLIAFLLFGGVLFAMAMRQRKKDRIKNEQLLQALDAAKIADRARADFFSRVSHDMRTPMNGILGLAGLSVGETNNDVLQDNILKIQESGRYLLGLINDTLDYQKMEFGHMQLQPEVISTQKLLASCVDLIQQTAAEKGVTFRVINKNANLDGYVLADVVCIKKLFINLLSNAVKFTPPGGTVELELEVLNRTGNIVHDRLTITDTGIGMSPEFLKNGIFKPFSQEYNQLTPQNEGTGLGLSIAKQLAELLHATIRVESAKGVGTKFIVDIDFEVVQSEKAIQNEEEENKQKESDMKRLNGRRILLVEDHPINAQIAKKLLEKAGGEVVWVKNGKAGVEQFQRYDIDGCDAILMDIRMPGMDGLEAAKAIRELPREDAKRVPIIALTANAYEEDIKNALAAGMNAHLAKPVEPQKLYLTLWQLFQKGD
ncbi:MAG: transporter substrate-binding domain-containing protein [Christensenella sp.]|nr:transporter substrate-binding domain-containing protein [Christensenella sp.]